MNICTMCSRRAIAIWWYDRTGWTGWTGALCEYHFDIWFDNADAEPELEPDRLMFL